MSGLFQNKFRILSARLQTWNYANEGIYFITICTKNQVNYFGNIYQEEMQLSVLGNFAKKEWLKTIELRPDMNLELGAFVVMPNHIHGIIIMGENQYNNTSTTLRRDAMHGVSTTGNSVNKFSPQSKNLASIIRGYKSAVTTYARKNNIDFEWQPRFHDHIIRSQEQYNRISEYIINNPSNWKDDKFYI